MIKYININTWNLVIEVKDLKIISVPVILGAQHMIKKETDKYITETPDSPSLYGKKKIAL